MSIKNCYQRLRNLVVFRFRAGQMGVPYSRGRNWKLPKRMRFQQGWLDLTTPDDLGSKNAFLDIFLADVYGLRKNRTRVNTIIDIGAHVGFFSLFARMLYPKAIIHAYEPNPILWPHLSTHANYAEIKAVASAVGLTNGHVSLDFPGDSVFTQTRNDEAGMVKLTSIHDVVEHIGGRVDLLKLDCEGAEWEILQDEETLKRVGMIVMEYHLLDKHTVSELLGLFGKNGFEIRFLAEDHPTCGRMWAARRKIV